ncbi:MAG: DUF3127 domain-containing protein [Bacteroidales bacterium]|jgi:hypothetical protein|nr:DUF3127 domain-containing protein [Bacteroidales bacterium]
MEIKGKLIKKLPVVTGQGGRNGEWKRQDFILETEGSYPRKVCITVWGDRINAVASLAEGSFLNMSVDIESREFNEKWYTSVTAWKIESASEQSSPDIPTAPIDTYQNTFSPETAATDQQPDDLPF